jgi:hypothetical protein
VDEQTRDRFLTGVTGRLRAVLPRVRQVTVFGRGNDVLYDSSGFAGPIELEGYHRTRDTAPVQTHDGVTARCAYDEDGMCLALFSLAGPGGRHPWNILLRIQEPRGTARVGESTVRRLAPLLRRLCAPLSRLPAHDPALDRRLAVIAQERSAARRRAQLLLTCIDVLGASAVFVSVPALGEYAAMYAKHAPRGWRDDAALRQWVDALAPSRLSSSIAVSPGTVAGAPAGARGVLCVPLSGLPGRTVGRFVLLFAADEPLPIALPTLLRLAALVVGCVAEERDRLTGVWQQKAFLQRAAALRDPRLPADAVAVLYVRPDWSGWEKTLEIRLRGLQSLAAFLRAKLPPQAVLGLARGGAFVALLPIARAEAAERLAGALTTAANDRAGREGAAIPGIAVRHATAGTEPGAFTAAIAEILQEDAARPRATTSPTTSARDGTSTAGTAPTPDATSQRATSSRATSPARASATVASIASAPAASARLRPLWSAVARRGAVLLVRAPRATDQVPFDPNATGVFVDAPMGVDLGYLDAAFRETAALPAPATVLLSVAATSLADRTFRRAVERLAAPLAERRHALHVLVSARYADEHSSRVAALRAEGWKVGLHLFAGGRLQVRELAATRDECVFVASDLVQDCLRSELSRLQLRELLARTSRSGYRLCADGGDVAALERALAMPRAQAAG